MISNGTDYLRAINDRIALNVAREETRNALVSLGHMPQTVTVQLARESIRTGLKCMEHENERIRAECKEWECSAAAAREASSRISLDMAFPERDLERVA